MSHSTTRSGGPKTAEGKLRSSLNALTHGLNAQAPHALQKMAEEHGVPLEDIVERMTLHYKPTDPIEEELVLRISRCIWRLSLSASMEKRLIDRQPDAPRPGTTYERIMRFERLVDIHLHRAIATLRRKRETERTSPPTVDR